MDAGTKQDTRQDTKDDKNVVELKRELNLLSACNLIISSIIGTGIFVSPSAILSYSGSVGLSLVIWVISGILSLLGGLVYAELASLVPRSGSTYVYFMESFAPLHKFWGPLPGFVYSFVYLAIACPVGIAILMLVSAEYLMQSVLYFICIEDNEFLYFAKRTIAIFGICVITYINAVSVKLYAKIQNVLVLCKILVCLIIIGCGIYQLSSGKFGTLSAGFEGSTPSPKNLALALYSGIYAYGGSTMVTTVTQEIKKPRINVLRSVLISVPFVMITYLFMNVSYLTTLTVSEMTSGVAVATLFGEKIFAPLVWIISLGVAISAAGCTLAFQFGITRICYAASQNGHSLNLLSFIHVTRMTPVPAVVMQGAIACLVVLISEIFESIEFTGFILALCDVFAIAALFILRRNIKTSAEMFRVPTWVAIVVGLQNLFLVVAPVTVNPEMKYLVAIGFIILAFIIYWGLIYRKVEAIFMKKVTYFVQMLFEVVPPEVKQA